MSDSVFHFEEFELHCGRFQLLRRGRPLRVEPKPLELLILLVSRKGNLVSRQEIVEKLWASDVFVDTEHGINTAIRKLRHLLRDDPEEPKFIQTVTGMGYRFVPSVTTITSMATDSASGQSGAASVQEEQVTQAVSARKPRHLWILVTAGAAVLIVAAVLTVGPHPLAARLLGRNTQPISSIAVLPLENLSGDSNQEYFADGMTDELTTMLARNSSLPVTSRTSVMQYKGIHRPLRDIARELNVDGIVEGSVERTGNRLHMTLQLIRADTDSHLWAESYDRSANDAIALPAEAALAIANHLHKALSVKLSAQYVSPEAYDAYLHGRYLWYAGWEQNEKAGEYFKKAIQLQPDYALAWAGLAAYYAQGAVTGDFNPRDSLTPLESAAAKAVELDDSLPEAHLAMSAAVFMNRWDLNWAQRELHRALELNPRFSEAYHLNAMELTVLNRHDEAIEAERKALELEPSAHPWGMLEILSQARQYDAAIHDGQLRIESNPRNPGLYYMMMDAYRRKGMYKEAVDAVFKLNEVTNNQKEIAALRRACNRYGSKEGLVRRTLTETLDSATKGYVPPDGLAVLYAQLGDRERTIRLLEDGFIEHSPRMLWIQTEPAYDFLHNDPRYRSLVQRIGLPPAF